jgi:hypothetical protein
VGMTRLQDSDDVFQGPAGHNRVGKVWSMVRLVTAVLFERCALSADPFSQ